MSTATRIVRTMAYRGEELRIEQVGSLVEVTDFEGYPYARISTEVEGQKPPEGHFWLRWWSENQHLAEAMLDAGILTTTTPTIQISHWVQTVAARIVPAEGA